MAVTPQTNTTLDAIARELASYESFCICGHVSPDGDCIGSQLALAHALERLGKRVSCVLAHDEPLDQCISTLPGAHRIVPACTFEGDFEVFVGVDVPTPDRMGDGARLHAQAQRTVTIDHHAVPERMSDLSYTDPDAASTTVLVWETIGHLGVDRSGAVATCAYAGLMTDTGRFQFQNADARAFAAAAEMVAAGADPATIARDFYQNRRLASVLLEGIAIDHLQMLADGRAALSWIARADRDACGAVKADAEPLVDVLRSLTGVRVACMLREQEGEVRGSFRAKDDTDVAAIARELGGGGHRAAAGFTVEGDIDHAVSVVRARLEALFAEEERA